MIDILKKFIFSQSTKRTLFFIGFIGLSAIATSKAQNNAAYYSWLDTAVGIENTALFNGVEYIEKYRTINSNHPFLDAPGFLPGAVIYDGQAYYDLALKYQVYDDLLLLKIERAGQTAIFQLISENIEAFSLNGRSFVHIKEASEDVSTGFYEVINETNGAVLLKKHLMRKRDRFDKTSTYYEFSKDRSNYLLKSNNQYYSINSKREVQDLFPEAKKEINTYYTENRMLQKQNEDTFMKSLFLKFNSIPARNPQ